jgi:hypothetical protein
MGVPTVLLYGLSGRRLILVWESEAGLRKTGYDRLRALHQGRCIPAEFPPVALR